MSRMLACAALLLAVPLLGAEKVEKPSSGLAKGEALPPFQVADITGPAAPNTLCYR
jgi:hypothetical protein